MRNLVPEFSKQLGQSSPTRTQGRNTGCASKIQKWEWPIASRSWQSSGALPSLSRRHSNKPNYQSSVKMQWDLRGLVQCTFHASFVRDATGKYPMSKLDTFLPIHVFMSKCGSDGPTRAHSHPVRKLVLGTWPWGHSAAATRAGIGVAVAPQPPLQHRTWALQRRGWPWPPWRNNYKPCF